MKTGLTKEILRKNFKEFDIQKGGKKTGYYTDTSENRKLGRVGKKYKKDKKEKRFRDNTIHDSAYGIHDVASKKEQTSKEKNKVLNTLLKLGPQKGKIIGSYHLANLDDWAEWKREEYIDEVGDPRPFDSFIKDLKDNVQVDTIDGYNLLRKDQDEEEGFNKSWIENVHSINELKDTSVKIPEDVKYFTVLPVDYNREGGSNIVVAFMNEKGKKYGKYFKGDY